MSSDTKSFIRDDAAKAITELVEELNERLEEAARAGLHVHIHATHETIESGGPGGHGRKLTAAAQFVCRIEQVQVYQQDKSAWDLVLPK